jgi:BirA family biotin operon repressor/biotin-[acetyl-CoA-carboxylase] ligase
VTDVPLAEWQGKPVSHWAERWQIPSVEAYRSLGSTSDRTRVLADRGAAPFTVVVSDEQRSGRGRAGKSWHSPAGCGLWLSVVLPRDSEKALPISFLVGLAAAEAIELHLPGVLIRIEWPNDLIAEERKIGGILCEASGAAVIAGVGINLRTPESGYPEDIASRATSLEAEGANCVLPSALGGSLLARLKLRLAPPGRAGALDALRVRDALAGRLVETEQFGRGLARGIAEDGSLVLERHDGTRVSVVAGSVRAIGAGETA